MMIDIALGLFSDGRDADLAAFAREVNASYMSQWRDMELFDDDVEGWGQAFEQVVTRTLARGGRIHFNLTGLNIGEALGGDPDVWVRSLHGLGIAADRSQARLDCQYDLLSQWRDADEHAGCRLGN